MMNINMIDNKLILFVGLLFLASFVWFFKWFIQKSLNTQFDKMNYINSEEKKEREYEQFLILRGQQVSNDCLHELIYAVINGTHNGGLQKANEELESYRILVDKNIAEKAARWSNKIWK